MQQTTATTTPSALPGSALPEAQPKDAQALGGVAMRGLIYIAASTILMKLATSFTQIVLGWKLTAQDMGVYSTATAIAGFIMVCREAGVREHLILRGPKEYDELVGPAFWLGLTYNVFGAIIISIVAIPIARYLDAPIIAPVLWCLAWAVPLGTLGAMLQTGMRIKLMFKDYSSRATISGVFRQSVTIGLAFGNFAAMSLAWAALITGAFESITSYFALPEKLWKRPMRVNTWWTLLRESRWAMFANIANFAVDWGPFLTLPLLTAATKAVQGYFFFAWNITAQLGILLAWGMMLVLTPVLARMNEEPQRQRDAVLRSLRGLMMLSGVGCLALAAAMDPLEHLIWHGKWEMSTFPVVVLGVFFPWRTTFGLTSALLQAQGRFKRHAVMTLVEGAGLTLSVTIAALIDPRVDLIAWAAGLWLVVSRLIISIFVFRKMGIKPFAVLGSTLPAWAIAVAGCAGAIAVDRLVFAPLLRTDVHGDSAVLHPQLAGAARAAAAMLITTALSLLGMRLVLRRHIEDSLQLLPARMQRVARLVLRMPQAHAS